MARIIHTADWHLGARLVDNERIEEHEYFLQWLGGQLEELQPDLLIIAGDIFDSAHPSNHALGQYYRFLARVAAFGRTQVLVLGGNHDSPLTLHAPRELLRALRIKVIGSAPEDQADALVELDDTIICAGPYLRERDVRRASPAQSFEQVAAQIREGIGRYYGQLLAAAQAIAGGRPIVGTGHLTSVGASTSSSERAIHIGNLGAVSVECFAGFDYVALGHLHRRQCVGGIETIRYPGSPVALSFDETDAAKELLLLETAGSGKVTVRPIGIPSARVLVRVKCTLAELDHRFAALARDGTSLPPWIELTVEDGAGRPDLDVHIGAAAKQHDCAVLKVIVPRGADKGEAAELFEGRMLAEVRPEEVFAERLKREGVELESEMGRELTGTFAELLSKMQDSSTRESRSR